MSCVIATQVDNMLTTTMTISPRTRGCTGPVIRAKPKMPGKLLQCRAKSEDFSRKLLSRFILSDDLYLEKTDAQSPDSGLLNMPFEILGLVYATIDNAPSQVAFALTCKRMALVARDLDLKLSKYSAKYAGYLPKEVFDVPGLMRHLKSWMPPSLRLCDHCLTNRPCSKEYWNDVDGCESSNFWITKTGWARSDACWQKQVHNICPACHVSCSLSDYVDCDGCRALGRLGDVDWSRVSDHWRRRSSAEEPPANHWDLTG